MPQRVSLLCLLGCSLLVAPAAWAKPTPRSAIKRFSITGSGKLRIRSTKNRHRFAGRFRDGRGRYRAAALRRIDRVIGVKKGDPTRISLRLIEVLSFLQSRLKGGWVVISSGYRSPAYNRMLRAKGRTVAKASLHQYGMAVDLKIERRDSEKVWRYARKHRVGGAGYYGSPWIHLDTGPVRFWTQGSANVRKGLSDDNKRVILVPEYDVYRRGERVRLRFARMTAYPIGVKRQLVLERKTQRGWQLVSQAVARMPKAPRGKTSGCARFTQLEQMGEVSWQLPSALSRGRYRLRAGFCGRRWPAMPASISSYEIVVR